MILVPELQTVVILVPRTGSGALYRAVLAKYPRAMMLYRHMEADGIPVGYTRWRKVGIVRHPINRLWSLYNYIKLIDGCDRTDDIKRIKKSVECSFEKYVLENEAIFGHPFGKLDGDWHPRHSTLHGMPENFKSQFITLRPDLGTEVFKYETQLQLLFDRLEICPGVENKTNNLPKPKLSGNAVARTKRTFCWEASLGYDW